MKYEPLNILSLYFIFFQFFFVRYLVVAQSYKVEVETLAAPRGCTAILRCVIPTFVREYVRVVSWVQEPAFFIYPSLQGGMCTYIFYALMNLLDYIAHEMKFSHTHTLNKYAHEFRWKISSASEWRLADTQSRA